jgi:hypothetical protein
MGGGRRRRKEGRTVSLAESTRFRKPFVNWYLDIMEENQEV